MKILITGAKGMVGKNLLDHPSIKNFHILAPSRNELDLKNFPSVYKYLIAEKPDLIIHAAGKVGGIQANVREPVTFLMDNLEIGRNIVWAAKTSDIKKLINLGSSCMYPRNHMDSLTESMILTGELEPTNEGYALAKVVTARLCDYIRIEDETFQYKTIIPCNLYGHYDKFDPLNSHLIPAIIHKMHMAKINEIPSVEIWGDGTARREFMYAGDLADALIRAVSHFDTLPNNMNIGLGYDYSINDYYQTVAQVINYHGEFIYDKNKPVGMTRKLLNVDKQLVWGWTAKNNLQDGISKTYDYYLKEFLK